MNEGSRLEYSDYLAIVLPCENDYLRAEVTQRPTFSCSKEEYLHSKVERELSRLFDKEIQYQRELETLKTTFQNMYDFSF